MSKRAVLLGTGAFPLILNLWLDTFKIWQDEVDVAYIAVDTYSERGTRDYIIDLVKKFPKAKLIEGVSGWPNSYKDAYLQSKEDSFLIMHDDCLVYKKGIVDKYFKIAEEGRVAVPFFGIYEPAHLVNKAITEKYGWEDPPYSFLLYFLFISRINLEKTSINFNGIGWNKGDNIPLFGMKNIPQSIAGDTGFILAMELFDKEVEFYKISRSETAGISFSEGIVNRFVHEMRHKAGIFKEGWLHLQNTGNTIPLWFNEDIDARKWNKQIEGVRLAWFNLMLEVGDFSSIPEFKKKAEDIFNGVKIRCGYTQSEMDEIMALSDIFYILLYG